MALTDVIALNVRLERARRRWNQGELGEMVGLSRSGVCDLEVGRRKVQVEELVTFCRVFDITLSRLLDGAAAADLKALGLRK